MTHWFKSWLILGFVWMYGGVTQGTGAQVIERERDSTITGPRGRSIERKLDVQRGPGFYQRQLQIQRPGGTLERDMTIQRGFRPGFGGGGFWPRPPAFLGREFLMLPRPANNFSFGLMAAPMITIPFGVGAGGVAPGPAAVGPAGPGGPGGSGGSAAAPAQPSPLDPVALAASKLQSLHSNSRRDGARELGRLGDPRAVPALVHVLKYDSSKDVRIAAATALGEIGGSEVEVVLERCIIYEKKQDVRDAAAAALRHARNTPQPVASTPSSAGPPVPEATIPPQQSEVPQLSSPLPSPGSRTSPFRPQPSPNEPSLEGPGSRPGSDSNSGSNSGSGWGSASGADSASESATGANTERLPPPAPVPVKPQ
ncbi:MAG: HEAT repeat domain-containing protein [Isosphaeraceae bacterium]